MKKIIFEMIGYALLLIIPFVFVTNGYGIDTWEWWVASGGVLLANIAGIEEGKEIEKEENHK